MRALYLSRADEFRDTSSLVIIAKSVFRHMLESDPEMYVTWVVPRGTKDDVLAEYVLAPLGASASRMNFVKAMAGLSGRTLGYFLTEDVWYLLTQTKVDVPYDVVLSNQPALTGIWHTVLTNKYQSSRYAVKVPIVNWQMWTATLQQLKEVPEYYAGEPDVIAESLSSVYAVNVWESEVLYQAHLDTMKKLVQPHVIRKIMDQSVTMANGVDWPRLADIYDRRMERQRQVEKPSLFWGGRLSNQKKPRVTFPLMRQIATAARLPGENVVISTNRPESDPDVGWAREEFPDWALHTGVDRTGFFGLMAKGDVFVCNSPSESYGVAWLEMLAVGMLGVFEKAWWNETLLPDWYPFVAETHEEQARMAVALLNDWPDGKLWKQYVPQVRRWIEDEHNEQRTGVRLGALLREVKAKAVEEDIGKGNGSIGDLCVQAAELAFAEVGSPVHEDEVWRRMGDLSDSGRTWGDRGDIVSRMFLRRCMEARGWVDVCEDARVMFRRPTDAIGEL